MRLFFAFLLVGCAAVIAPGQASGSDAAESPGADASYDDAAFGACAACHLADGVGIPAAFPPVRNRASAIALVDGGRDYLITVVSFGVMGALQADGAMYDGLMPGHSGSMSADEIASALNYLVFELNDDQSAAKNIQPFTAAEVGQRQSEGAGSGPATGRQLREDLIQHHGDRWPH